MIIEQRGRRVMQASSHYFTLIKLYTTNIFAEAFRDVYLSRITSSLDVD